MDVMVELRDTEQVPRQPQRAVPGPDDWTAERIRYEREKHGWSTAELARRVTMAGLPMRQQQIWQIESGTPRRRVSIGEALAIAAVFEISLGQLTRPPDNAITEEYAHAGARFAAWRREAGELFGRLLDIARHVAALAPVAWPADAPLSPSAQDAQPQIEELTAVLGRVRQEIAVGDPRWETALSFRDITDVTSGPSVVELIAERDQILARAAEISEALWQFLNDGWDLDAKQVRDPAKLNMAWGASLTLRQELTDLANRRKGPHGTH